MEKLLIEKFNLPSYIKDKSFADASKSINKKFEGRNDKVSIETKEELLQRLAKAQEYLKEQSNIEQSDTNQAFFGGDQIPTEGVETAKGGLGAMDYMSLASGALNVGKDLFGKTGIDTSGASGEMQSVDKTGAAISGAKAGMALGPVGAGVGAIVGGAASLVGAGKTNRDIQEANNNNALKINSQYNSNFAKGGPIPKLNLEPLGFTDIPNQINFDLESPHKQFVPTDDQTKLMNNIALKDKLNGIWGDIKQGVKENYGDALRYSPAVMNAIQLKNLEKPEFESLDRLDNRYNKDLVDESALRNNVQHQFDNTRNAITNASTGSVGATRANLLGAQANSTNALSNAMLQAENINRGENQREQQFNLGVDNTNLQQSNAENELNARNKGIYDSNKSQLLGQLGNDLGNIGKEQKYKQMVKDMGLCYDSRGAYICGTEERIPDDVNVKDDNKKSYGGNMDSNSLFTTYLEQLLSKKK